MTTKITAVNFANRHMPNNKSLKKNYCKPVLENVNTVKSSHNHFSSITFGARANLAKKNKL